MHPNTVVLLSELCKIRKERHLTQETVANSATVMPASLSNWEQLKSTPSIDSLCRWADALGYELDLHLKDFPNG